MASGFKNRKWFGLRRDETRTDGNLRKKIMGVLPGFDDDIPTKEEFYAHCQNLKPSNLDDIVELRLIVKGIVS